MITVFLFLLFLLIVRVEIVLIWIRNCLKCLKSYRYVQIISIKWEYWKQHHCNQIFCIMSNYLHLLMYRLLLLLLLAKKAWLRRKITQQGSSCRKSNQPINQSSNSKLPFFLRLFQMIISIYLLSSRTLNVKFPPLPFTPSLTLIRFFLWILSTSSTTRCLNCLTSFFFFC